MVTSSRWRHLLSAAGRPPARALAGRAAIASACGGVFVALLFGRFCAVRWGEGGVKTVGLFLRDRCGLSFVRLCVVPYFIVHMSCVRFFLCVGEWGIENQTVTVGRQDGMGRIGWEEDRTSPSKGDDATLNRGSTSS